MSSRKYIFHGGPSKTGTLLLLVLLCTVLLLINIFSDRLDPLRTLALDYVASFYKVTDIPGLMSDSSDIGLLPKADLQDELRRLRNENLILSSKAATMATVLAENTRLRQLLNAAQLMKSRVLITEVIGIPPNSLSHRVIIDRGMDDGVSEGVPVIDASGLIGQVVATSASNSELLLISDRSHAVPVETLRSGSRMILEGIGNYDELLLRNISITTDVQVGDELVTSGLGGVFPRGYPVGTVLNIAEDDASAFLKVSVKPAASLATSRHLLLLFETRESLSSE